VESSGGGVSARVLESVGRFAGMTPQLKREPLGRVQDLTRSRWNLAPWSAGATLPARWTSGRWQRPIALDPLQDVARSLFMVSGGNGSIDLPGGPGVELFSFLGYIGRCGGRCVCSGDGGLPACCASLH